MSAHTEPSVADMAMRLAKLYQAIGLLSTLHGSLEIDVDDPVGMAQSIYGYVSMERDRLKLQVEHQARTIDADEKLILRYRGEAEDARQERDLHARALELQRDLLNAAYQDKLKAEAERDKLRAALVRFIGVDTLLELDGIAAVIRAAGGVDAPAALSAIEVLRERWTR